MRRVLGCGLLLASVITIFTVIAATLIGHTLSGGTPINVPLIVGVVLGAFVTYCVGMALLTSLRR